MLLKDWPGLKAIPGKKKPTKPKEEKTDETKERKSSKTELTKRKTEKKEIEKKVAEVKPPLEVPRIEGSFSLFIDLPVFAPNLPII